MLTLTAEELRDTQKAEAVIREMAGLFHCSRRDLLPTMRAAMAHNVRLTAERDALQRRLDAIRVQESGDAG